jgi:hypothetical protein
MNKKTTLIIALCLVLAGSYYLYENFKIKGVKQIVKTIPSKEALMNPLLAGQRLLERGNIEVKSFNGLFFKPGSHDIIFLDTKRLALTKKQSQELLNWVYKGGHLIITPPGKNLEKDFILTYFGVKVKEETKTPKALILKIADMSREFKIHLGQSGTQFSSSKNKSEDKKQKSLPRGTAISYYPLVIENNEFKVHASPRKNPFYLKLNHGEGVVSILAKTIFLHNEFIGLSDHALIFWALIAGEMNEGTKVWLVPNEEMPPLFQYIWRYAWALVISLAITLVFWIWRAAKRFGPTIREKSHDRNRFLDHIEANANFFLRNQQINNLIESIKQSIQIKLESRRPGWVNLKPDELHEKYSEISGYDLNDVKAAMFFSSSNNLKVIKKIIITLEKIRQNI